MNLHEGAPDAEPSTMMNLRRRSRRPGSDSPAMAYLQLVRLPNVFTAMADVAMGLLFVRAVSRAEDIWVLGLLLGASSLLYASGMVLNDLFDVTFDARWRPDRPLPSRRVSLRAARWLGWELMLLGLALSWSAAFLVGHPRPGIVAVLLAACIVLYDAVLKQTPLGPVAMGGCRLLNVLLGMSVTAQPWRTDHWLVAGGIGLYIVGVTWFARTEARRSRRWHLGLATVVMMLGIGLLAWFPDHSDAVSPLIRRQPDRWHLLIAILAALIGLRCVRAVVDPTPSRVQIAVKQCILSLVILDAAVCCVVRGTLPAVLIALLLVPAAILGRWMRST